MNFYKHFIGDYQRDTGHLTLMEHGAYRLMLDTFYATQKPLPKDRRTLYRLLRAEGAAERKAIDSVVAQFWALSDEGLVNLRAQTEIGKAQKQAEVNRQIAHAREEKKRLAKRLASANEAGEWALSGESGCKHGFWGHPENQVYEVSRADGSSKRNEKQAINGANVAKKANKDAFMAMTASEGAVSGQPQAGMAYGADMAGERAFPGRRGKKAEPPWDADSRDEKAANPTEKGQGVSGDVGGVRQDGMEDRPGLTEAWHSHSHSHSHSEAHLADVFSAADLAGAMRRAGIAAQAADPRIMALAHQGISPETVAAACAEAKRARPHERIGPVYVVRIVERWAKEASSIAAYGAKAHGRASHGSVHAERKRVMEALTGKRMDEEPDRGLTIEGSVRVFEPKTAGVVFDRGEEGDDGFSA